MILDLATGKVEKIYSHLEDIVGAYQLSATATGIIVFDSLNFLITLPELGIIQKGKRIYIFFPKLNKYIFDDLQYICDYMIRNNYTDTYEDISVIVTKLDYIEYKNDILQLRCNILQIRYSKKIEDGFAWVIHNGDKHYKGYTILIKNIDQEYKIHVPISTKEEYLTILGMKG